MKIMNGLVSYFCEKIYSNSIKFRPPITNFDKFNRTIQLCLLKIKLLDKVLNALNVNINQKYTMFVETVAFRKHDWVSARCYILLDLKVYSNHGQ